jgi:hypothetical protein
MDGADPDRWSAVAADWSELWGGFAGLDVVTGGLVELPWEVPDDGTLVRGVLMGEDPATMAATAPTVLAAARPFRTATGGYRLDNAFRFAVGRAPA